MLHKSVAVSSQGKDWWQEMRRRNNVTWLCCTLFTSFIFREKLVFYSLEWWCFDELRHLFSYRVFSMDNVNWDVLSEHLFHATSPEHVEPADNTPDSTTKTNIKQMMSWSLTCLKIFPQVNTTHHWRKVYLCKVVLNHPCFNTTSEYSNLPHHILLFIFPICNLTRTVKLTERNQKLSWDCFELKKYKTILQIASEIEFDKM